MYTHRRNRHPQLSSPARSPFPPLQGSPFFDNIPHPSNSHYEEQERFEDPRCDYLGYAAPRYDGDNSDDEHSHSTQSYIHWPPGPSYWETTQRARLPAHYLPSPWRDAHRSRLRPEREEPTETSFDIVPSIENDEQPSPVFPDTQWRRLHNPGTPSPPPPPEPHPRLRPLNTRIIPPHLSIPILIFRGHERPQRNSSTPDATPAPTTRSVSVTTSALSTRSSTRLAVPPQSSGGQPAPSGQDTDPSRFTGLAG
ncbi:hypothetical protein CMEL01_11354 [Colletotrichum melonis]|uniref:Uncharacterized protein n=1 Tax=Colletotrichum melonis TaxID=1209925 RepID=A0AAI9UYV3_9PEZI|nr:hypothetical protein CMEL01_11354 [Colletotrichum melonis]